MFSQQTERKNFSLRKTLVILAVGIGSRYGGGIKQLEPVDDYGHLIIDYSIHDAIAAGFSRIVFIIRHDIEADFRSVIELRRPLHNSTWKSHMPFKKRICLWMMCWKEGLNLGVLGMRSLCC